ncbi:SET domain-containing protein SmydA-8, isoform B [Eumeta japonica]|uniref:SET domain-containing protein SmydA-8, isoform B n=1 Tax=Eumeta variegata TaxID=151549 RepID=A0A4C1UXI8_EUMVA|nr:SET domain-containing protein SmydA-8, isoform B [Eumeta japonica]
MADCERERALLYQHLNKYSHNEESRGKWRVQSSPLGGRGVYATRRISKGALIFINAPLLVGPRPNTAEESFCAMCFTISDACFRCDVCGLNLCSESCRSYDTHVRECKFLQANWIPKLELNTARKLLPFAVIYLRSLRLSEENISLLSMLQKSKQRDDSVELKKLIEAYEIPNEQIDYMKYVYSILKVNSFRVSGNDIGNKVQLRGLYPASSFLNHSCVPNTRNVFAGDYTMAVYAAVDIAPGEEILTCYTGLLLGTPSRRHHLFVTKGFWCTCRRCGDTTENGTRLSAINCLDKYCAGVLLPVSPLDHTSHWSCDKCETKVQSSRIDMVFGVVGSLLNSLNLDGQLKLDSQILERLVDLVPFCSHVFVDLKLRLALKLGFANRRMIGTLLE